MAEEDEQEECQQPCNPNSGCEYCAVYWQRMEQDGYWDRGKHQWTNKGWREMLKG